MTLRIDDYDHVTVVGVSGEFAIETTENFRKQITSRLDQKVRCFAVDFQGTTFIDSKGLETLLWLQDRCDELMGQMRICRLDEQCRKILQVTRLEGRFDVHEDVADAVKSMR